MQAALAHDRAQLEIAEIQFTREQRLFDQKLVSQDEYDTSKASQTTLAKSIVLIDLGSIQRSLSCDKIISTKTLSLGASWDPDPRQTLRGSSVNHHRNYPLDIPIDFWHT
jgi:hypothetical protein